jgi:hypothetical protein
VCMFMHVMFMKHVHACGMCMWHVCAVCACACVSYVHAYACARACARARGDSEPIVHAGQREVVRDQLARTKGRRRRLRAAHCESVVVASGCMGCAAAAADAIFTTTA